VDYRSERPLRDNERELIDTVRSIDEKYQSPIVVVEGKRDVRVLRDLGITSPIIRTQTRRTREALVKAIVEATGDERSVLLLTDFDREGRELEQFLMRELEIRKVRVLQGLRVRVQGLMGNWRCIEEMAALFKRVDSPDPVARS
jgi:5S rRNA maturation endonuclease (ribonuclease M5)